MVPWLVDSVVVTCLVVELDIALAVVPLLAVRPSWDLCMILALQVELDDCRGHIIVQKLLLYCVCFLGTQKKLHYYRK